MKVYFVRHGQSEDDNNNISQGMSSPLSKLGTEQVKQLANELVKIENLDFLISSSLTRAIQTSEILENELGLKTEVMKVVDEIIKNPSLVGLKRENSLVKEYKAELKKISPHDTNWKFKGNGESLQEVIKRVINFEKILKVKYGNKNLIVVSHKTFISCFIINCLLGEKIESLPLRNLINSIPIDNGSVSCLEYVAEENKWNIVFLNSKNLS